MTATDMLELAEPYLCAGCAKPYVGAAKQCDCATRVGFRGAPSDRELIVCDAAEDELLAALKLAVSHIEHMAAWIVERRAGYSFESLGEDMPGIYAALRARSLATQGETE